MLTVNDLMTTNPQFVTPQMTVADVCSYLDQEEVRQLPVVDENEVVGIVTERDVNSKCNDRRFEAVTVEVVMTPNPITVTPETPAFRAAEMLQTYKFGALPVVDDGLLVGIVSVSDFLGRMAIETTPESLWPDKETAARRY